MKLKGEEQRMRMREKGARGDGVHKNQAFWYYLSKIWYKSKVFYLH